MTDLPLFPYGDEKLWSQILYYQSRVIITEKYALTCGVRNLLSVGLNFVPLCLNIAVVDFQMTFALYFVSFNKFITIPRTFWKVVKLRLYG